MAITRDGRLKESLDSYLSAIPGALTAAGMVTVTSIQRVFVLFRPKGIATGETFRSITVSPPYFDGTYLRVRIGPTTKYAVHLEFGRKPGKHPPPDAMLAWVKEKHLAGYWKATKRGSKRSRDAEDRQIAFLVGRAIAQRGTKPFPAVTIGFRRSKSQALEVFTNALVRGMAYGRLKGKKATWKK